MAKKYEDARINGKDKTGVLTGLVRFSYVNVFTKDLANDKYRVCLMIDKKDEKTVKYIKEAINNAYEIGLKGKLDNKKIKNIYEILHDGDEEKEEDENFKDCYYINASCQTAPGVVNKFNEVITDSTEFYSGCFGHASINFYAYSSNGSKGIACGLNNLMKVEDGEKLGGRARAKDDFKDFEYSAELEEEDEDDLY